MKDLLVSEQQIDNVLTALLACLTKGNTVSIVRTEENLKEQFKEIGWGEIEIENFSIKCRVFPDEVETNSNLENKAKEEYIFSIDYITNMLDFSNGLTLFYIGLQKYFKNDYEKILATLLYSLGDYFHSDYFIENLQKEIEEINYQNEFISSDTIKEVLNKHKDLKDNNDEEIIKLRNSFKEHDHSQYFLSLQLLAD